MPDGAAPAFTEAEHAVIANWAAAVRRRGLRVETHRDLYGSFEEILLVFTSAAGDPTWLVHKTPAGGVGVRLWPGLADIVPTVGEALARIMPTEIDQSSADHA